MSKRKLSVLFLGKKNDAHCQKAFQFCNSNITDVTSYPSQYGDPLPDDIGRWEGEYVISYLSRWIVPDFLLKKARIAAINFHPASPDYPGIGCNNFALYEEAQQYGVTCHHMAPQVDTGALIAVKRFTVFPTDDVASILQRTYDYQLVLFYEILSLIIAGKELPVSEEHWTRRPFTRKEFNQLGRITPEMSKEEVSRRIRATNYGVWKPVIEVQGFTFELKAEQNN